MSDPPLVSVITIFLNAEEFLAEAIESVFGQTYPHWELLLVDDGSTDGGSAIARGYAERHPDRVRYLEHPGHVNFGMSASRNLGLRAARGGLIALLDADDVWLPQKLRRQVDILRERPDVGMVFGTTEYWYSWTGRREDEARDSYHTYAFAPDSEVEPPEFMIASYPLGRGNAPCPSDLLFRAEVIDRAGSFEDSYTGMYEDQVFLAKVYLRERVFISGENWFRYRQHPSSCMSVVMKSGGYHAVRLRFLDWLEAYLAQEGVRDPRIEKALRRALWVRDRPMLHALRWRSMRARNALEGAISAVYRGAKKGLALPAGLVRRRRRASAG